MQKTRDDLDLNYGVDHEQMGEIFEWSLQSGKIQALVLSGKEEEEMFLTDFSKQFARNNNEEVLFTNLKNNKEIREYIDTHEPDREMWYFLEKMLVDMIVPGDTMLIFNNAHTCKGIWKLLKYFYEIESDVYVVATGNFTEEDMAAAAAEGYAVCINLKHEFPEEAN